MTGSSVAPELRIAVLVPCYNEGRGIAKVVRDFREALPTASIYVFDNNSKDDTITEAAGAGAIVGLETRPGKGNVVRRMFADVDADVYLLVDGDDTYDAASAPALIQKLLTDDLDMVVAARVPTARVAAYRPGHKFGNRLLTGVVSLLFGEELVDMLSGYRAFSRRFVKSFPALSAGFETETELTVHALALRMPIAEVASPFSVRAAGSESKLRTYRDGFRILLAILNLFKDERPLISFSAVSAALMLLSLALGYPVVLEFIETGLVPRFPTAILATGIMVLAFLSLSCGIILDTVTRGRREMRRLFYLSSPRRNPFIRVEGAERQA